jgi:hypothetical protein
MNPAAYAIKITRRLLDDEGFKRLRTFAWKTLIYHIW